jgi:ubiquinone/menaquinone biosynthesis C-methylase UbiE
MYSNKAFDYARHRPDYAIDAIAALIRKVKLQPDWLIADIGAGTGNMAKHFVNLVKVVYAVEPEAQMRRQAERMLTQYPAFHSLAGTAEATGLETASIDLIVVGQALHWFNPVRAGAEFARIIKPGGWLAAVENRFVGAADRDTVNHIETFFAPATSTYASFPMCITETWEQFIGGARSAAAAPRTGDPEYKEFELQQRAVFDAQAKAGLIEVHYTTELAVGRLNELYK